MSQNKQAINSSRVIDECIKRELSSKILHGTGIVFAGGMGERFVTLALNILLAKVLGPEKYGLYTLGYISVLLVSKFSMLGMQSGITRFNTIYIKDKDKERIKGTLFFSYGFVSIVNLLASCSLFFFAKAIAVHVFNDIILTEVIQLFAFALPFFTVTLISASAARAAEQMQYYIISRSISVPLFNLIVVSIMFFLGFVLRGAIFSFVLASVLSAAVGVYLTVRLYSPIMQGSSTPIYETKKIIRFSLPLVITGASLYLLARLDRLMLGHFSVVKEVGIYAAAANISSMIGIAGGPFSGILGPMMAEKFHNKELEEVKFLFQLVTRWIFIVAVPLTITLILYPREVLDVVYGSEYVGGSTVLVMLCIARLITTATGHTGLMLSMAGKQDWQLFNTVSCVIIAIFLNIRLIPVWGATGAAIAILISTFYLEVLKLLEIYIFWRLTPFNAKYMKPLISLVSAAAVCLILPVLINSLSVNLSWFLNIVVFLTLYSIIYVLLKIDEEDYFILSSGKKLLKSFGRVKDV